MPITEQQLKEWEEIDKAHKLYKASMFTEYELMARTAVPLLIEWYKKQDRAIRALINLNDPVITGIIAKAFGEE